MGETQYAEQMSDRQFMRTTYDPRLTELLSKAMSGYQPQRQDPSQAIRDEMETVFSGEFLKPKAVESSERVSEEEMQLYKNTEEFLARQEEAEAEFNEYPLSGRYEDYSQERSWPRARAEFKARMLSTVKDESGIDIAAYNKVHKMFEDAERLNQAYDVVASDGLSLPLDDRRSKAIFPYDDGESEDRLALRLRGDNMVAAGSVDVGMATSPARMYDIKEGRAVRSRIVVRQDLGGNVPKVVRAEPYESFAPQHQERAKELMSSLAVKQHIARNEQTRKSNVKQAREVLGRGGVKAPKLKK